MADPQAPEGVCFPTLYDAVNDSTMSGLSKAAFANNVEEIKTLLKNSNLSLRGADNRGWTAFHWAAANGGKEALQTLFSYVEETDYQDMMTLTHQAETPLHIACIHQQVDCAQILLEHGASPASQNHLESTPLHLALDKLTGDGKTSSLTRLLVTSGLTVKDMNLKNHEEETPLFVLLRQIHTESDSEEGRSNEIMECLRSLLGAGADPLLMGPCVRDERMYVNNNGTVLWVESESSLKKCSAIYTAVRCGQEELKSATHDTIHSVLSEILNHVKAKHGKKVAQRLVNMKNDFGHTPLDKIICSPDHFVTSPHPPTVDLLMSFGARPSALHLQAACRCNPHMEIVQRLLTEDSFVRNMKDEVNSGSRTLNSGEYFWTKFRDPFTCVLTNTNLSEEQRLEWLDCLLARLKPDDWYQPIQMHPYNLRTTNQNYLTPLASWIGYAGFEMLPIMDIEQHRGGDFDLTVVKKLVEKGGSSVNAIKIQVGDEEISTVEPLFEIFWKAEWDNRKVLEYLCQNGAEMSRYVADEMSLKYGSQGMSWLNIFRFTEFGIIKPELLSYRYPILIVPSTGPEPEAVPSIDYVCYTYISGVIDKLGASTVKNKTDQEKLPEYLKNKLNSAQVPSLEILSCAAVRRAILEGSSAGANINRLIDSIGCHLPRPVIETLKLKGFPKYLKLTDCYKEATIDRYPGKVFDLNGPKFVKSFM